MSSEAATQPAFDSMKVFMGSLEKSLGRSLQPLEKISKQMGGSKFGKNVKKLGSAFKGMASASVNAWAMEQLMKLIEPFMRLLKLLEIPINVLSMLLSLMVNEIFVDLLPYFIDFSLMLMELAPTFKILGKILSWLIEKGLIQLIKHFERMYNFWKIIITFLVEKFIPIWEKIKLGMEKIKNAWDESGGKLFGKDGLIARGLRGLFNIAKSIINTILGAFNNIISGINSAIGLDISRIPLLAKGGLAMGPTLAMIGDNKNAKSDPEVIAPLSKLSQMGFGGTETNALLEENNKLQRQMLKYFTEKSRYNM